MKANQKAALVTGGSKRIGKAICLALAEKGYDIALHYSRSETEAEETAGLIRTHGAQCALYQCDLRDTEAASELIPRVVQTFPNCNCLVNSASVFKRGAFMDSDLGFLDQQMAVNFRAPYLLTRQFARICESGLVVNMLDTKVTRQSTRFFAYTLSKKLLHAFTKMAAAALGPKIRVNGICPGIILPSTETSEQTLEKMIQKLPLQRKGDPEKITRALIYLIENDFVTGECLFVDGGEHL